MSGINNNVINDGEFFFDVNEFPQINEQVVDNNGDNSNVEASNNKGDDGNSEIMEHWQEMEDIEVPMANNNMVDPDVIMANHLDGNQMDNVIAMDEPMALARELATVRPPAAVVQPVMVKHRSKKNKKLILRINSATQAEASANRELKLEVEHLRASQENMLRHMANQAEQLEDLQVTVRNLTERAARLDLEQEEPLQQAEEEVNLDQAIRQEDHQDQQVNNVIPANVNPARADPVAEGAPQRGCHLCGADHYATVCPRFANIATRLQRIKAMGLCERCLKRGDHPVYVCPATRPCHYCIRLGRRAAAGNHHAVLCRLTFS